ncbi:MAG: NADH-quinone oxidoreductase subunit H, partial [Acidobacteria bacterium]|nr:NADH-quinone oxidoreductase subunit H [Acidobacteriota bacterium]
FNALFRGVFWFMAKIMVLVYSFMWVRFTFPRYRYDQLMRLGWRVMIPLGIVNVIAIGIVLVLRG